MAEYRVPFLAHATMEPMNATARVADGRCEVWTGVQDPLNARKVAAEAARSRPGKVTVHNQQLGGGFGRRLPGAFDYVDQAVRIAKELSPAPVKLIWSREEDLQHDYYRPAVVGRYKGAWTPRVSPPCGRHASTARARAALRCCRTRSRTRTSIPSRTARTCGWARGARSRTLSMASSRRVFIDELAHAAGKDPFEFRRNLLAERAAASSRAREGCVDRRLGCAAAGRDAAAASRSSRASARSSRKWPRSKSSTDASRCIASARRSTAATSSIPIRRRRRSKAASSSGCRRRCSTRSRFEDGRVVQTNFHDHPMPKLADSPSVTVEFIAPGRRWVGWASRVCRRSRRRSRTRYSRRPGSDCGRLPLRLEADRLRRTSCGRG